MIENEDYHLAISEKSRLTQHYSWLFGLFLATSLSIANALVVQSNNVFMRVHMKMLKKEKTINDIKQWAKIWISKKVPTHFR